METRPRQFSLAALLVVVSAACVVLALFRLVVTEPVALYFLYLGCVMLFLLRWAATASD